MSLKTVATEKLVKITDWKYIMISLEVTIIQLDHECKLNSDVLQFYIPCNQLRGVHYATDM